MEHGEHDMMSMMMDMHRKMDLMMKKMGISDMSKDEYMSMPDEEKDEHDERNMKSKMKGM